jgi:3',5'-cyclic AMP phosphodiesterase CpdA
MVYAQPAGGPAAMTTILHLSDLHLVDPAKSPRHADVKVELLHGTGGTYYRTLRSSLESLSVRLLDEGRPIDAIVMSGDVAHKNAAEGFDAFIELLGGLGSSLPPAGCIVVVPGNHDVHGGLLPGDGERYRRFAAAMRGAGYVTPLLDGIDPKPDPHDLPDGHLLRVGDVEIIPINSSGYSQIRIDTGIAPTYWDAMKKALQDAGAPDETVRALGRLERADAARIDEAHLEDVARLLKGSRALAGASPNTWPVRIGVMHHQLLPVSVEEEVKAFESLTNLGQVRQFFREQEVTVLLHGHKHQHYTYVDYIGDFEDVYAPPHALRVITGPAPTLGTFSRKLVARLLTVDRAAGMLKVEAVPAAAPGKSPRALKSQLFPITVPAGAVTARTNGITVVDADTVKALHARVLYLIDGKVPISNLVARLGSSPDLREIAALYDGFVAPDPEASESDLEVHADAMAKQFEQLVEWWQNPVAIGAAAERSFTHGNRILRYAGHIDQLEDVAAALENDSATTRSVLVLLQPGADRIADHRLEFPSFCLAQFGIRTGAEDGVQYLDCVAYFRKLELRYWWLVNLAELSSLQRKLATRLMDGPRGKEPSFTDLEAGSIVTLAARAEKGAHALRVQVPTVDRYYAVARQRLSALVYALVFEGIPERDHYGEEWVRLLKELVPPAKRPAGDLWVSVEGLDHLRQEVVTLTRSHPSDVQLSMLATTLSELVATNESFAVVQRLRDVSTTRYRRWAEDVDRLVTQSIKLTAGRILTP